MTKEQLLQLLEAGKEVYATSYIDEEEIAKQLDIEVNQVEYVAEYDGEELEWNDRQFVDGDRIYLISTPETRINELKVILNNPSETGSDEEIVALEEEYMNLTGTDEIRYPL